jgi:hypothetical protein
MYITRMVLYLKGVVHLTLDHWQAGRSKDGWPVYDDGWRLSNTAEALQGGLELPKFVKEAERLRDDLKMLQKLTEDEEPPWVPVRARETAVGYLLGDASDGGFGTSLWTKGMGMIDLTYGTFGGQRCQMNHQTFENSRTSSDEWSS